MQDAKTQEKLKELKPRQERIQRLEKSQSSANISFSGDLLLSARIMLKLAFKDRKGNLNPPQNNHQSKHSIGSILLLVAGLESWFNEAFAHLSLYDSKFRQEGNFTAIEKYEYIYNSYPNAKELNNEQQLKFSRIKDNLKIVFEVRNEIAHAMPLATVTQLNLPPYFMSLHEKGLLITTGKPTSDYALHQKIRSYALAYWCWIVVNDAVSLLVKHIEPDKILSWTAQNFSVYSKIACPPENLKKYDAGKWRGKRLNFV